MTVDDLQRRIQGLPIAQSFKVPPIISGTGFKFGGSILRPRFLCSTISNGILFGWTLLMYWPNLKSAALPVPEIIAIGVLGGGCELANPQSWGRGGRD